MSRQEVPRARDTARDPREGPGTATLVWLLWFQKEPEPWGAWVDIAPPMLSPREVHLGALRPQCGLRMLSGGTAHCAPVLGRPSSHRERGAWLLAQLDGAPCGAELQPVFGRRLGVPEGCGATVRHPGTLMPQAWHEGQLCGTTLWYQPCGTSPRGTSLGHEGCSSGVVLCEGYAGTRCNRDVRTVPSPA